jgi:hypothetical protein
MRYVPLAAATFAAIGTCSGAALADPSPRISGPFTHENLAIYFVHGQGADGPVPLTLQEALAKGSVVVAETGQVNELQIENTGGEPVFIQAGDIVKGGKQDRVLTVSLLLPPSSGRVPIASFCVEQGRWAPRGKEDHARFTSAKEAMPSREALLAMVAPPREPAAAAGREAGQTGTAEREGRLATAQRTREPNETASKQRKVWEEVAATQRKLTDNVGVTVASQQSASSLQLSLENEKLKEARAAYIKALQGAGEKDGDVIGYVVAINGRLSVANIYPSNGLFRKMWAKQLAAVVTEAIGEKRGAGSTAAPRPPAPAAATEFMAAAEQGKPYERTLAAGMRQEVRDADKSLYNEARASDGKWIHRSYLAK